MNSHSGSPGDSSVSNSTKPVRQESANLIEAWVDEHGDILMGYVLPRVRDQHVAEDMVQETFLAAIKAIKSFRGDSSPRTWLLGLLRHKIADHYRKRSRDREDESIDAADALIDGWFDKKGSWINWPKQCEMDPAQLLEREDFWVVLESCIDALPERLAAAFTLRKMDDRKADEVCKVLSITPTNLWVALHRARARLRACLEVNWFESDAAEKD